MRVAVRNGAAALGDKPAGRGPTAACAAGTAISTNRPSAAGVTADNAPIPIDRRLLFGISRILLP